MVQLLGSIKIVVKYPVTIRVDNIGAIFMASNTIVFVKSDDNDSNILTKNLSADLHEEHLKKMVASKP